MGRGANEVADADVDDVTEALDALEVAPGTMLNWKVTVDPSLKVTDTEIGPGA